MRNQLARPASITRVPEQLRFERIPKELSYLLNCSRTGAGSFRLRQLAEASNLKRQAAEAIRSAVQAQALALFAEWVEKCGEEWIEASSERGQNPEPAQIGKLG